MPGSAAPKEGSRRAGSRHLPKRTASSASSLQRDRQDIVITGYTHFNTDLPPLPAINLPRSKSSATTARSESHREARLSHEVDGPSRGRGAHNESSSSRTSVTSTSTIPNSGVSSACLATSSTASTAGSMLRQDNQPRHTQKRSSSTTRRVDRSSETSHTSSAASARTSQTLEEDDVTCAICLDLLHRPRSLPCGHTFCLVCLQNYVNSCRSALTCPSCRGAAQVPTDGVVGLPVNSTLARGAQEIRERREGTPGALTCAACRSCQEVRTCGHCRRAWCAACSPAHLREVRGDVAQLRRRLATARDTLSCTTEEDEMRFSKLEETIGEAVDERVAQLHDEGRNLAAQVQELRAESQRRTHRLSQDIEKVLASTSSLGDDQAQLEEAGRLHSTLLGLLRATSRAKGPRVTLDQTTLTLSGAPSSAAVEEDLEGKDEEDDEQHLQPQDHSLLYRSKGSLARQRWGQHLGERPAGVAVNPWTSDIYVTGSDTCRVYVFDTNGRQVSSFGSRGHADGQFLCPIGLAFSHVSREVFITDKWKHCIHVFDAEGHFIRQLGRKGKGFGHFSSPEGIATDRHGNIYVADTCNHRVQILDGDGVFLREVGVVSSQTLQDGRRYTKSEFNEPTGVAASLDGSRVYVADSGNHRIKVFNGTSGERVLMFGSRGRHKGQFETPECIVVDHEGFILVGDSGNGRVQVFRPNGNFVRYLGTRSNSRGEFGWVSGVGLSKGLDVVVTDFKNNLVAVF
ncbi:tripartite motif-containing protein 3 isoform X2 [Procambarus clarkii]